MSIISTIHVGARALGITDDDDRRDLYERVTGKRSLAEMAPRDLEAVCSELHRLGFRARGRVLRRLDGPYAPKLQALWISAWNLGLIRGRDDAALVAFVRRQTGIDHTRFLRDPADASKAIEALKGWLAREAGVDWSPRRSDPAWMRTPAGRIVWAQWGHAAARREPTLADAVRAILGPGTTLQQIKGPAWHAVTNALGARIRGET